MDNIKHTEYTGDMFRQDADSTNNGTELNQKPAAAPGMEEQLKAKYGKVYRVSVTLTPDDETELNREYFFKRPSTPSYDRYLKTASKGMSKATKAFVYDNIADESKEQLDQDLAEFPALAINLGDKLLELLGLTSSANLIKL